MSIGGRPLEISCKIGIACGPVFAAEVGEPRGRREFNILGDTVNTAARLMTGAAINQILVTEGVCQEVAAHVECESLGLMALKGKAASVPIYAVSRLPDE